MALFIPHSQYSVLYACNTTTLYFILYFTTIMVDDVRKERTEAAIGAGRSYNWTSEEQWKCNSSF